MNSRACAFFRAGRIDVAPNSAIRPAIVALVIAAGATSNLAGTPIDPLNTWNIRQDNLNSLAYGVAYGNGTWVAAGSSSNFYTSPNGAVWTQHATPSGGMPRSLTFGDNLFVSCGFDGKIMTSPDGFEWTHRDSPLPEPGTSGWGWSVLHANGLFVAAAGYNSAFLVSSPDGVNWTRSHQDPHAQLRGLAYGNGRYVATGPFSLATSADGLNWTAKTMPPTFFPVSLAYGNNRFVGVGAGYSYTSNDGLNWTTHAVQPAPVDLYQVTFGNGVFVAVDPSRTIWTSTDGEQWTLRVAATANLLSVAYAQGRFVAVGTRILQSGPVIPTPPLIVRQPAARILRTGQTYSNLVVAESAEPVSYQWQVNGTDLPGATNANLVVNSASPALSGQHTVRVSNNQGSEVSVPVVVQIADPPKITVQPLAQEVVLGGTATLSVEATGTLPLSFRWRRGGTTVALFTLNQRQSFLSVTDVQAAATYTVVVSNVVEPVGVLSQAAPVTIVGDTDHDGLPDAYEIANGLDYSEPGDAGIDSDHDGAPNGEEYVAGTDPNDVASVLRLSVTRSGGDIVLEFPAAPYKTYTVQVSQSLAEGSWQKLGDAAALATTRTIAMRDDGAASQRFYRVVTPAQP